MGGDPSELPACIKQSRHQGLANESTAAELLVLFLHMISRTEVYVCSPIQ